MNDHMNKDFDYLSEVFTYHPPKSQAQIEQFQAIRNAGFEFADLIRKVVPPCRESDNAIDHVRNAVMWANAGLALHDPTPEDVPEEVIKFFGNLSPENARAIKAALEDGGLDWDDAYNWVAGGPAHVAPDPQKGEHAPFSAPDADCGNHPGYTCAAWEQHWIENADAAPGQVGAPLKIDESLEGEWDEPSKPVAQETYLTDDERIGALQIGDDGLCAFDGAQVSPTGNVFDNGNDLVCLNCGRTGPYSLVEEEQTDEAPKKGCPECGMNEPHVHIDDKTFLGDENGPEIRVLSGMSGLMEHFGVPGVPYVVIDESMDPGTFRLESGPEKVTVDMHGPGVTQQGVADLVKGFLDRNPNALVEPIGQTVKDWIGRGRAQVRTIADMQSGVRKEDVE